MEKFKEILKGKITERVTDGEVIFNSVMKNNGLVSEEVMIPRKDDTYGTVRILF